MSDTTLINQLRSLGDEGFPVCWRAADALEQQAAQIADLQLTKSGLIGSLRDEMDEGLRLRELGGALPDENITAMTERIIGERSEQAAQIEALRAERDAYKRDFEAELAGNGNMRKRFGALPTDTMFSFLDRLEAEFIKLRADAERYRWLRVNHETFDFDQSKGQASLWEHKKGSDYGMKSGARLDAAIDAALRQGQPM